MFKVIEWTAYKPFTEDYEKKNWEPGERGHVAIVTEKVEKTYKGKKVVVRKWVFAKAWGEAVCYNLRQIKDWDPVEAKVAFEISEYEDKLYTNVNLVGIKKQDLDSDVDNDENFWEEKEEKKEPEKKEKTVEEKKQEIVDNAEDDMPF